MIEVRCCHRLEDLTSWREQINYINRTSARPDPFSTFEFFENFLRYDQSFPEGMQLWFLMAFENAELIGYLALKKNNHSVLGMRAAKIEFLVTHDADCPHLVVLPNKADGVSAAFYNYLWQHQRQWSLLEFRQQYSSSDLFPLPPGIEPNGFLLRQWPSMNNGTINIKWDSVAAYYQSLSHKFRANLSRLRRRLFSAGDVSYIRSSDQAVLPHLFTLYQTIASHSWKAKMGGTIGRVPHWQHYFRGLLSPKQPMRITIHLLLLNNLPIAGLITGAFENKYYALDTVFDDSKSDLAPGSTVLLLGIEHAIKGRFTQFDLLSGFEYYKQRWLAQISRCHTVQIYRKGSAYFWHRWLGDWRRRLFSVLPVTAPQLFNPLHRLSMNRSNRVKHNDAANLASMAEDNDSKPNDVLKNREQQAYIETLLMKIHLGSIEYFSSQQLTEILSFKPKVHNGRVKGLRQGKVPAIGS